MKIDFCNLQEVQAKYEEIQNKGYAMDLTRGKPHADQLNLANDEQHASNILDVLRNSVFQVKDKIGEELDLKKALKFYISLHANFRLSSDASFIIDPPAVLSSETVEIFE